MFYVVRHKDVSVKNNFFVNFVVRHFVFRELKTNPRPGLLRKSLSPACTLQKKIANGYPGRFSIVCSVHERRLELPSPCGRYHLKVVRLPISPLVHLNAYNILNLNFFHPNKQKTTFRRFFV